VTRGLDKKGTAPLMPTIRYPFSPYCGAPPSVATLWTRWNLDPSLIVVLAAILVAYVFAFRHNGRRLQLCYFGGWGIGALALISPLCALSVSLFTARVGQHMILTLIVAPLMAMGLPRLRVGSFPADVLGAAAFALALWIWHAPGPYTATFESTAVYWLMHVTTFGAALFFWMTILATPASKMARAIALTLATSLQMAFLGAVITFSSRPLYPPHAFTTQAWGLTALQDQQLGGSLMWAPAGLIFLVAIVAPLAVVLRRADGPAAGVAAR